MKNKIKVTVYSKEVISILKEEPLAYVHSIFKKSMNIKIKDRLIHLGREEEGVSPFSICISRDNVDKLVDKFKIGDELYTKNFNFEDADIFDPKLSVYGWEENLARNIDLLNSIVAINPNWKSGIEVDISDESFPDKIIGKGLGLTPSGDDVLVGLLAILQATGKNKGLVEKIKNSIKNNGRTKTTDISYEYLDYAVQGKFSKVVKETCIDLIIGDKYKILNSAMKLIHIGHTSGMDTLKGILLGAVFRN
ncbi:DUF2877 domain-containing protein [Tissierella sp.]|uniref:DUF2877 domain-containing protein n=1 Tax=Tissierella sp. TaxID=41274 RepID=UPI0028A772C3|nr:DUF2877 domain-containing protein [Tissierella sp.]